MIETIELLPGVTLRSFCDRRFKQGCLSIQLVRPMARSEAAMNALIPAVLLRGSQKYPDLRAVTARLDELYGASVGTLVRRVGDYQTTGLYCNFIDDRFALEGDRILSPVVDLLRELLFSPCLSGGVFRADVVESEKKNLISTLDAQRNDKRAYAAAQLLKRMCSADSYGVPRLGEQEQVEAVTPESLFRHYRDILRTSRAELFYVGSAPAAEAAALLSSVFAGTDRDYVNLPAQTPFRDAGRQEWTEEMAISQGRLCMGFVSAAGFGGKEFVAMQLANLVFGAGQTSKLFMNVRERLSACYEIGSAYYGSKGIVTVSAGIDNHMENTVREEILAQLAACQRGEITGKELSAAKEAMISSLRSVYDSPGAIENYYATAALSGLDMTPEEYCEAVEQTGLEQIVLAARSIALHSVYFLKGVTA